MSVTYRGMRFETRLLARWAAFFDLAKWNWQVNPAEVEDWLPDFRVSFPCAHSECRGSHTLLVAVLPVDHHDGFGTHPCFGHHYGDGITEDGGAAFGASPKATYWEIVHGAGGGVEDVYFRVDDADQLWQEAGTLVS